MVNRRRGHHFRVKLRSRTQQPQEKTAMPVRPVHHRRNLNFCAVRAITHMAILRSIS
jgi:hypothetical protein